MTSSPFSSNRDKRSLEFTAMFDALSPAFRASVSMRALRSRDHIPTEAGRMLDSAIRGSIRLIGYTNPALAISSVLLEPVANMVAKSEKLATAALQVWAESHNDLQQVVLEHLEEQDVAADYPDLLGNRFRGFWEESAWRNQMEWIAELTENWNEDDIALMLCYVSGKTIYSPGNKSAASADSDNDQGSFVPTPILMEKRYFWPAAAPVGEAAAAPPGQAVEPSSSTPSRSVIPSRLSPKSDPPPPVDEPPEPADEALDTAILSRSLDYLDSLAPEDPIWDNEAPEFLEAVHYLSDLKLAQRERRANLATAHEEIIQEFTDDLDFLEQDISEKPSSSLTDLDELARALDLIADLKSLLMQYREARSPGKTLSEEISRRESRSSLEPRILDALNLLSQVIANEAADTEELEEDESNPAVLTDSLVPRDQERSRGRGRGGRSSELVYEPMEEDR